MAITKIQFARGAESRIPIAYPNLNIGAGEPVFATDSRKLYVGTGQKDADGNHINAVFDMSGTAVTGSGAIILSTDAELPAAGDEKEIYIIKADSTCGNNGTVVIWDPDATAYERITGGGNSTVSSTSADIIVQKVGNQVKLTANSSVASSPDKLVKFDSSGKVSADIMRDGSVNKVFTASHASRLTAVETTVAGKSDKGHTHTTNEITEAAGKYFVNDAEKTSLAGIDFNIKQKLTDLTIGVNWKGSVNTYANLTLTYPAPEAGWAVFVTQDETHAGARSLYVYNTQDRSWHYQGDFQVTPDATAGGKGSIKLAGDITGSADAPQLAAIPGVVAGTYTNPTISVDEKGRVVDVEDGAEFAVINDDLIRMDQTYSSNKIEEVIDTKIAAIDVADMHAPGVLGSASVDESNMGDNRILMMQTNGEGKPTLIYSDMAIASLIDDTTKAAADRTYSSAKIETDFAPIGHTHTNLVDKAGLTTALLSKADSDHKHDDLYQAKGMVGSIFVDETNKGAGRTLVYDQVANVLKFVDAAAAGEIHDDKIVSDATWSSNKINNQLTQKADVGHVHSDLVKAADFNKMAEEFTYSRTEVDGKVANSINDFKSTGLTNYATKDDLAKKQDAGKISDVEVDMASKADGKLLGYDAALNKFVFVQGGGASGASDIDDTHIMTTRTFSSQKIDADYAKINDTDMIGTRTVLSANKVNALLGQVATNVAAKVDQSTVTTLLANKADKVHDHDTRYYQKGEVDGLLASKANEGAVPPNDHPKEELGTHSVDETGMTDGMSLYFDQASGNLKYGFVSGAQIQAGNNIRVVPDPTSGQVTITAVINDWAPGFSYKVNDFVMMGGVLYRALLDHVSAISFSTDMATGNEKWATISGNTSGGAGSDLNQVTKLGVVASTSSPKVIELAIPDTPDLKRPPIEVLKFVPGTTNVVQTICSFDNSDATSFVCDDVEADLHPNLVFDGTMRLKTQYDIPMVNSGALGTGNLWTATIDRTQFKTIESIQVI